MEHLVDTQEMMDDMIEIGTKSNSAIGRALSNFRNWGFTFDGIECKSIESVLQSFKFPDVEEQKRMCNRMSFWARKFGYNGNNWKEKQILFWKGKEYPRDSKDYQTLLDSLFETVFTQNEKAKETLLATKNEVLLHSMGSKEPSDTVLTEDEFVIRLMKIRDRLRS